MSIKHLHELLQEDQEPFHIIDFIANHRYQLKSSTTTTTDTTVFLHVPTMLRDAAMRVQQQSSTKNRGLFRSFFKLLKHKTTQHNHHVINYYPNEIFYRNKMVNHNFRGPNIKGSDHELRFPYSYNGSRVSSEEWSEKLTESSETTCSPSSPFRFCLLKTPSRSSRTPEFLSPTMSPSSFFGQDKDKQPQDISVYDDEQCSPMSVLDPSYNDFERSYSSIQRTKDQLLETLLRFERLLELDPIGLERHMLEQCYKDEHDLGVVKFPSHDKKLALDFIVGEKNNKEEVGREEIVTRVCGRLNSWKMVESKAIGTIVEFEFRSDNGEEWKKCDGEMNVREIGLHIEVAIFEELVQEFVTSFGH